MGGRKPDVSSVWGTNISGVMPAANIQNV